MIRDFFRRLLSSQHRIAYDALREEVARLGREVTQLSQTQQEANQALATGVQELLGRGSADNGRAILQAELDRLAKEIVKLGREQFKANTLREGEAAGTKELIENLARSLELARQEREASKEVEGELKKEVRLRIVTQLLLLMDALEASTRLGEEIVQQVPQKKKRWRVLWWWKERNKPEEQILLVGPFMQWLEGVKLVQRRLGSIIAAEGVVPLESLYLPFNPHYQRAVGTSHNPEVEENIIIQEDLKGYSMGDRVIRYAEVIVNKVSPACPSISAADGEEEMQGEQPLGPDEPSRQAEDGRI